MLGSSGGVVKSLDFCQALLKFLGCFYFQRILSSQWKVMTVISLGTSIPLPTVLKCEIYCFPICVGNFQRVRFSLSANVKFAVFNCDGNFLKGYVYKLSYLSQYLYSLY